LVACNEQKKMIKKTRAEKLSREKKTHEMGGSERVIRTKSEPSICKQPGGTKPGGGAQG